jgi:nitrogen PTS system EIIA component
LDPDDVLDAIWARGDLRSCTLGRGVALPDAVIAGLERPLGVFARLEPSVDFDAEDWEPIDLVLLVLSPAGHEGTHLRALSCAARRLSDLDVRVRLRTAAGADAIHVVLTSDAWRGSSSHKPLPLPTRDVAINA